MDKCGSQDKYLDISGWWTSQSRSLGWPSSHLPSLDTGSQLKRHFQTSTSIAKSITLTSVSITCELTKKTLCSLWKALYTQAYRCQIFNWWISHLRAKLPQAAIPRDQRWYLAEFWRMWARNFTICYCSPTFVHDGGQNNSRSPIYDN